MKTLLLVLGVVSIVAIGCGQLAQVTPAPEVEIVYVNPLATGFYLDSIPPDRKVEEIRFQVFNGVDAVIKRMDYDYFASDGTALIDSLPYVGMHLLVSGDSECVATSLLNVPVPLTNAVVNYIITTGDWVYVTLTFSGEDAFGLEKEFETDMDWGIQGY